MPNSCGDCEACCYALAVAELDKGSFCRCTRQRSVLDQQEHGCTIHGLMSFPESCHRFLCAWRQDCLAIKGVRSVDLRPDRSGVVVWGCNYHRVGKLLAVSEAWAGAMVQPPAVRIINHLSAHSLLMLIRPGRGTLVGPAAKVAEAMRKITG